MFQGGEKNRNGTLPISHPEEGDGMLSVSADDCVTNTLVVVRQMRNGRESDIQDGGEDGRFAGENGVGIGIVFVCLKNMDMVMSCVLRGGLLWCGHRRQPCSRCYSRTPRIFIILHVYFGPFGFAVSWSSAQVCSVLSQYSKLLSLVYHNMSIL